MDEWDPIANSFHDKKFNSYNEGVGRDLTDSMGGEAGAKLYVGNLPKALGNEGLFNLFSEYGTVESAVMINSEKNVTFGFVNMRTAVEGELAISKLHNKKLGNLTLKVNVAMTKEEKERRKQAQQKETELMSSLKRDFNYDSDAQSAKSGGSSGSKEAGSVRSESLSGRKQGQGIEGIDRSAWHSLAQTQNARTFPQLAINVGRGTARQVKVEGSSVTLPLSGEESNSDTRSSVKLPSAGRGLDKKLNQMKRPGELGRGLNNHNKKDDISKPGAGYVDLRVPENTRLKEMKCCSLCLKEGCKLVCSLCGMYYCSVECQKKDWPEHKNICLAFREYYKLQEQQSDSKKIFHRKGQVKNDTRQYDTDCYYESDSQRSVMGSNRRKQYKSLQQREEQPLKTQVGQSKPITNGQSRPKMAAANKQTEEGVEALDKPKTEQRAERLDKATNKVSLNGENVDASHGGAGDATYGQVQISVPIGSAGQAYLTYYESPDKFWISLAEQLEEFTETTLLVAQQASCSPPTNPQPRQTYGVLWDGEWARVEVISVSGRAVTVFFMDYGNTGVVKMEDLRPLTLDTIKLPAQALCCCVSKVKPIKGSSWSESAVLAVGDWFGPPMTKYLNFEIVAKKGSKNAVKISINNEAVSEQLLSGGFAERDPGEPGLHSITVGQKQAAPKRFTIKELKSEMAMANQGSQLRTALTDLQSLKKFFSLKESAPTVFQELEPLMASEFSDDQTPYRPVPGEIVAAKYSADNNWYRSHVLKVSGDTCSLFFVDYGNSEDQTVQNVREIKNQRIKDIPAQALVCCLHGVDDFLLAVPENDLLIQFAEFLPSFQVDQTWTLLSVKSKSADQLTVDIMSTKGQSLVEALRDKFKSVIGPAKATPPSNSHQASAATSIPKTTAPAKPRVPVELKAETLAISPSKSVSVTIPYIRDCSQFYIRQAAGERSFTATMSKLNESVSQRLVLQEPPAVGSFVAVQFSVDRLWYRGRVVRVEPNGGPRCKVMFVDYGNVQTVPWAELRELTAEDCKLPIQAVQCRLAGDLDGLPEASHLEFKQYLENETVDVKVVDGDVDGVAVHIFANGQDINALFFGSQKGPEPQARKIPNATLEAGAPVKVECVNLASPAGFYVQINSQAMASVEATMNLKARLEKSPQPVCSVAVGDFVASRFSQDDDVTWYRGRVEKVDGNKATVFFLDFGMFEERAQSELMCLTQEDCEAPAGTIRCQLKACEKSMPELNEKFASLGQSQIDSIKVISQDEQGCIVDVLDCDGKCITEMFTQVQKKSPVPAKPTCHTSPNGGKPKASVAPQTATASTSATSPIKNSLPTQTVGTPGKATPVTVIHVDSCSGLYVWCMDEGLQGQLLQLMVALNECAESLPPLSRPRPGSLCAACFSQDGSWYRARVVSVGSATCVVQFVDYGNSEESPTVGLRELDVSNPALTSLPAQAVKCCLLGFEESPGVEEDGATLDQLRAELLEKPVNIKVVRAVGEAQVVEMQDAQGQSVSDKFKHLLKTEGVPMLSDLTFERPTEEEFPGFFLQLTSLDEFFCQRFSEEEMTELMTMGELLQSDVDHLPPGSACTPVVNGLYTSQFQGVWYRCVVEQILGSKVVIRYIDFGNAEEKPASELKPLLKKRVSIPVRLLKCKLSGVTPVCPGWEHAAMPDYLKLLSERQPLVHIQGEGKDGVLLVSLIIENGPDTVNVAQDLVSIGMATQSAEGLSTTTQAAASAAQSVHMNQTAVAEVEDEDELALARQIEELQRQLQLTKLKKAKGAKN